MVMSLNRFADAPNKFIMDAFEQHWQGLRVGIAYEVFRKEFVGIGSSALRLYENMVLATRHILVSRFSVPEQKVLALIEMAQNNYEIKYIFSALNPAPGARAPKEPPPPADKLRARLEILKASNQKLMPLMSD